MGGGVEISATIAKPGLIRRVGPTKLIRFVEVDGSRSARAKQFARVLSVAGIDAELVDDISLAIWNKFVFLTGLSAMTALTRYPVGMVRADPDTRDLLEQNDGGATRSTGRGRAD